MFSELPEARGALILACMITKSNYYQKKLEHAEES
jgi:hypothetical protein